MDREPLAYLSGGYRPQSTALLALHDAGFALGVAVSDLCRTFRHRLFRLPDHLARFRQSCELARIPQPRNDADLTEIAERLVTHNAAFVPSDSDLILAMFATPGPLGLYLGAPGAPPGPPTLGMYTFPVPIQRDAHLFRDGARLATPTVRHIPPASLNPWIKHRNRLAWWIAEKEVQEQWPGTSALLLDDSGHVTETATANVLICYRGAVLSPPRGSVLGGISLRQTEELCRDLGIPFREQPLSLADCLAADEMLLTSTPFCIAAVREVNGVPLPCPGPLFLRLLAAWGQLVGLDIAAQFLAHTGH